MRRKAYFYAGKNRQWTRRDRRAAMWRRWVFMRRLYRYWERNGINWRMSVREFSKKIPGIGPILREVDSWKQELERDPVAAYDELLGTWKQPEGRKE